MLTIVQAESPAQVSTARQLIEEYAAWLEFKLCFQGFEDEMQSMPGKYARPAGRLLLALWDGKPAAVIALRPLEEAGLCEMKRLYVRPEFRGHNIGRLLAERVIREAAEIGYARIGWTPSPARWIPQSLCIANWDSRKLIRITRRQSGIRCLWSWH
jgi:GNAT superfamily N-acetyltransferase